MTNNGNQVYCSISIQQLVELKSEWDSSLLWDLLAMRVISAVRLTCNESHLCCETYLQWESSLLWDLLAMWNGMWAHVDHEKSWLHTQLSCWQVSTWTETERLKSVVCAEKRPIQHTAVCAGMLHVQHVHTAYQEAKFCRILSGS